MLPQTPPQILDRCLLRSRTTLFASFSGKRRVPLGELSLGDKASPQTPRVGFAEICGKTGLLRFLLLFLEKEEQHWTSDLALREAEPRGLGLAPEKGG
jgi:hypothetical protein